MSSITLLNTKLKVLVLILVKRLQIVVGDLIGPEQNYPEKERSIQNNLHFVREIVEGIEDDNDAALISSIKAFDRLDHRFLAVV